MTLRGFIQTLSGRGVFDTVEDAARRSGEFFAIEGMRVPLLAALLATPDAPRALLVVTATRRESEQLADALRDAVPDAAVLDFPAWETLPHERLSPSPETVGRRIRTLRGIRAWEESARRQGAAGHPLIVLASIRAALQPIAPGLAELEPVELLAGGRGYSLNRLAEQLIGFAYARVDMVARRGEFAIRGGILDVFPPDAEHPVRAEFFGDELETLREFGVADQRSLPGSLERVEVLPSRELLLGEGVRGRARQLAAEFPNLGEMMEKVAEGIPVEGMESLSPALLGELTALPALMPERAAIALIGPEKLAGRAASLEETNREFLEAAWSAATAGARAPIDLESGGFLDLSGLRAAAGQRLWWRLADFQQGPDPDAAAAEFQSEGQLLLPGSPAPSFTGQADGAIEQLGRWLGDGWSVVITAEGIGMVQRAVDVLGEHGLAAREVEQLPEVLEPAVAYVFQGRPEAGLVLEQEKLALLTDAEFFGRSVGVDNRAAKRLASRRRGIVDPLQLSAGDYVVHETHGIGRFVELTQREVSTGGRNPVKHSREYLVLEYAPSKRGHPGDKLYVPTDQLELLSRYVGGEAPSLSKMGGSDWSAAKGRARKAVREIAVELVKLYAARMQAKGHAFAPDTPWQRELEEAFPFVETNDQLTTIDEVKADMERAVPMDRLVAGDVGYGKTEIAVRAAFKAVQDGKQVAILVPTTLLVRQHMETFQERYAGFPVHLRALSRFQSESDSRETIAGLADGSVDIVIGTHRLLSGSIAFKELGLVIIDEEQRFGVEHKEQLKKLKTNVDVLAMSATPIPRTLEMAVTGIREMSTLATPPEARLPILTFVGPRSNQQIGAAIRRELLREGQVFFVHNRVSSINRTAAQLAEIVPEARIAVAHGQLPESVLEQVMVDFWERRFDVLVSTTIIETGLDIANANTLIIDRADKYGLSQLHQLRGRVGRGRERGYAYFLYDPDTPLSETAHERLSTIAANNELGSGMQVALKDLELRGAGNLLGGEQSGHIAGVGFDLYLRMIGEAVSAFRGDDTEARTELRLELPVDAHIPEEYVESERLRLEAYQKLSVASSAQAAPEAVDAVLEELDDRYGTPPAAVLALAEVARLRRRAQLAGLSEVVAMGSQLRIAPASLPESMQLRLKRMYPGAKYLAQVGAVTVPLPGADGTRLADAELIAWAGALLDAMFPLPQPESAP